MSENNGFYVRPSWSIANQRVLNDAITMTPSYDWKLHNEEELTDMVQADKCVLLSCEAEENGNNTLAEKPCAVDIRLGGNSLIARIIVVSEARVIEVCGACGEYLVTVGAQFLDEVDDVAVYCADIRLQQPLQECSLRFARLKRSSEMWLYGVRIIVTDDSTEGPERTPSTNTVDLKAVEKRLKESGTTLSEKAQRCKQFLEMYGSSMGGGAESVTCPPNPVALLSMLGMKNNLHTTNASSLIPLLALAPRMGQQNVSDCVKNINLSQTSEDPQLPNQDELLQNPAELVTECEADVNSCLDQPKGCSSCLQSFELILDRKMEHLQNSLLAAMDQRMEILLSQQQKQFATVMDAIKVNFHLEQKGPKNVLNDFQQSDGNSDIVHNEVKDNMRAEQIITEHSSSHFTKPLELPESETCRSYTVTSPWEKLIGKPDYLAGQQGSSKNSTGTTGDESTSGTNGMLNSDLESNDSSKADFVDDFTVKCEATLRNMMGQFRPPTLSDMIFQMSNSGGHCKTANVQH